MASYDIPENGKPPKRRYSLAQALQDMQHNTNADMMQKSGDQMKARLAPTTAGVPAKAPRKPMDFTKLKKIGGEVAARVNNLAPYYSNIVNSFKKAPMPIKGVMNTSPTLSTVDYSNERNDVYRNATAADRNTERNVDPNTAEAVKLYRKGTTFHDISSINDRQNQTNLGIKNQQAMLDYQNSVSNNAKTDDYNQSLVERDIANQRESSANFANAGDKITLIRNENQKAQVEMDKAKVLSSMYQRSGVLDRNKVIKQMYPDLLANGGAMRMAPKRRMIKMC